MEEIIKKNNKEFAIQKAAQIFRYLTGRPIVENKDITTVLEIASFLIKNKDTILTYSREYGVQEVEV